MIWIVACATLVLSLLLPFVVTPVVGTLASALILREPLGWDVWLALALIVGGIALGTVPGGQPTAATPCRTDRAP